MEQIDDLLHDLVSNNNSIARKSFFELESIFKKKQINKRLYKKYIPLLAEAIEKNNTSYWPLFFLELLAENKVNISEAVDSLTARLNMPFKTGGRDHVIKTLDRHYININKEKKLKPKDELLEIDGWKLQRYSHRPFFSRLKDDLNEKPVSTLPCPFCSETNVRVSYSVTEPVGTNISGADIYTTEIACLECNIYSVFTAVDSFGSTG